MSEREEQVMWLPDRGLTITLPPESSRFYSPNTQTVSVLESARYSLIYQDHILKKRHPTAEAGQEYMASTDLSWRELLYDYALEMSNLIVQQAQEMSIIKTIKDAKSDPEANDIAVLMFGSVAKRLSKKANHHDPSNIDLAVLIPPGEGLKEEMFDRIREKRETIAQSIGNNVGVHIQTSEKVRNGDYSPAFAYIRSSTRALYDNSNVWKNIETEALLLAFIKQSEKAAKDKIRSAKILFPLITGEFSNIISQEWQFTSERLQEELKDPQIEQAFRKLVSRRLGKHYPVYEALNHPEYLLSNPIRNLSDDRARCLTLDMKSTDLKILAR